MPSKQTAHDLVDEMLGWLHWKKSLLDVAAEQIIGCAVRSSGVLAAGVVLTSSKKIAEPKGSGQGQVRSGAGQVRVR